MATTGDDCYFFYYSTCTKGSLCPYRHCAEALGNEVTCINWKQGFCYRPNCAFRHMDITKNRSEIPCYWESQPLGCQKPHCPFKHVRRVPTEGANTPTSTTSLINKLPTITGPVTKPLPPAPPAPVSVPAPAAAPMVNQAVQPSTQASQDVKESIAMLTVKPVVVTPMDSEDDESVGTMSTDGSPAKRLQISPMRLSSKPTKDWLQFQQPIRTYATAKPASTEDKPLSLGIKTLAEIRREKNRERGHSNEEDLKKEEQMPGIQEEQKEAAEEEQPDELGLGEETDVDDFLNEDVSVFPSLTRRIVSASSITKSVSEEKESANKPSNRRALILTKRKGETGMENLVGLQDSRTKRLCRSLEQGDGERGNIKKRIKISKPDILLGPEGEEEPKIKVARRVVVGGGAGTKKDEADSSGLDSIKIKTVAEIKKEKLAQRLGKRVINDDNVKDDAAAVTSSASRRVADRLGKVVQAFGSDNKNSSKNNIEGPAKKRNLAERLGTITRTVTTASEGSAKSEVASKPTGSLARRLRKAGDVDRAGHAEEKASSRGSIKVKSLEEIKRERLLKRLGKVPNDVQSVPSPEEDENNQDELQEDEEEEDEEEEEVGEEEEKKKSSEVRIKTLAEIRLEKQSRLGPLVSSNSTSDVESEKEGWTLKKGVQSTQERRNRKRTEMALYKPPAALRSSKENQASVLGLRRSILHAEEKERKSDEDQPIKVRRLNLSKSVESANKGTESVLTVIKQKNEGATDDQSSIKVKSLAEIRAEKQRLGRLAGGDSISSASSEDQELAPSGSEEGRSSSFSPEWEPQSKEKTEEGRRQERRAKIWRRANVNENKPANPFPTDLGKGDEGKSQDQIRRERRARLWNVTPSGDADSRPVIRRPGQVTSSSDPSEEIKIKTLDEIRREKRLREQQQQNGNQAAVVSCMDSVQKHNERTDSVAVSFTARDDAAGADSMQEEREERIGQIAIKTGNPTCVSTNTESSETPLSLEDHLPVNATGQDKTKISISGTKVSRKPVTQRVGQVVTNTSHEAIPVEAHITPSHRKTPPSQSIIPEAIAAVSTSSREPVVTDETRVGIRQEEEVNSSQDQEDSNLSLISLRTDPDSTTSEDNMVNQPKPTTRRLTSITDDEDLHRFLEEHDDIDDFADHKPNVAMATHDDDDLLNELDDFLNS